MNEQIQFIQLAVLIMTMFGGEYVCKRIALAKGITEKNAKTFGSLSGGLFTGIAIVLILGHPFIYFLPIGLILFFGFWVRDATDDYFFKKYNKDQN